MHDPSIVCLCLRTELDYLEVSARWPGWDLGNCVVSFLSVGHSIVRVRFVRACGLRPICSSTTAIY